MKFLTRINRQYLLLLSIAFALQSVAGFFVLHHIIGGEVEENLIRKADMAEKQMKEQGVFPDCFPEVGSRPFSGSAAAYPRFRNVTIRNNEDEEGEVYMEYSRIVTVNGKTWMLRLRQPLIEVSDLVVAILGGLLLLLLILFVLVFLLQDRLNHSAWKEFEDTLQQIEAYNLHRDSMLEPPFSHIEEFRRLNRALQAMSQRLGGEYRALREFTENASHEIQTPLSIALIQLDELLQAPMAEEQTLKISETIQTLKRLSSLNRSLILLTKIENQQFRDPSDVDFGRVIQERIRELDPIIRSRSLTVTLAETSPFHWRMNETLAAILVSNLMSNAIRHNEEGGDIHIRISEKELFISNSGPLSELDQDNIFRRFIKGDSRSFGLGLAIVDQICRSYGLAIRYEQTDRHQFRVTPARRQV